MQPAAYRADVTDTKADRRKLTVVMHADMVGYSRLVGLDDAGTVARLRRLRRELIDPTVIGNGGIIRQTAGDSLLAIFDSIEGAVQAAMVIQRGVAALDRDAQPDRRICFRIGINLGDAILDGADMHGDGVNIAVRLESACPPGGICVSRTMRDHARDQPGVRFERLGALNLKNIARPIEAFVLHFDESPATGIVAASRRLFARCVRAFRRFGVPASAAIATVVIALVFAVIYIRESRLPQQQEAARAEARHAEEMERLQALNATEKTVAEALAREKGIPLAALTQILTRLDATARSDDPVEVQTRLERWAAEYIELRRQMLALSGDEPKIAALRQQAQKALGDADFTVARAKLLEAANIDRVAALSMAEKAREHSLAAAGSLKESARVAALALRYRDAAGDLGNAAALALPFDRHQAWVLMIDQASMLRLQGEEFGDNDALAGSIDLYRRALALVPRNEDPRDWATTQDRLGLALRLLGEREAGTEHLTEAIAAYRAALEERLRQYEPRRWAQTQSFLGFALLRLGQRESETTHLQEAVTAFRAALEEPTRDRAPLVWAFTQNGLGNALLNLGARESGAARLEEAVAAYRAALEERTRDRIPLRWAGTEGNLGSALRMLGSRESGTSRLTEAVAAYRAALQVQTRDRVPLDWAETQNNLGGALLELGQRESGTDHLQEAVAAFQAALEERRRDRVPLQWAETQENLGAALWRLGERESGTAHLEPALIAFRAALEEHARDLVPLGWAVNQADLAAALSTLGTRETGTGHLTESIVAYYAALEEITRDRAPFQWAWIENNLGKTLLTLGEREPGTTHLEEAVTVDRAVLEQWKRDQNPREWASSQENLGNALAMLAEREESAPRMEEALTSMHNAGDTYRQIGESAEASRMQNRITEFESKLAQIRR
jgi:class 3 adenylate cyclase/tetratricopeptide (TPR) repeat protein